MRLLDCMRIIITGKGLLSKGTARIARASNSSIHKIMCPMHVRRRASGLSQLVGVPSCGLNVTSLLRHSPRV